MSQYIIFELGEEKYAVEVLTVKSIEPLVRTTPVPGTKEFVKGLMNLRGEFVPVIDARQLLGMEAIEPTKESRVIVADIDGVVCGLLVDSATTVIDISDESIQSTPQMGEGAHNDYLSGVINLDGSVIAIFNVGEIVKQEATEATEVAI
ncbi:chemotaxis protein CheW [Alicyclobacillus dauci]|uniref:Chemotaxis protein CheW n=1 Tax=Alicyclobacillus dauci TaxID=1475485 RepID=A0ABY6Z155_9BACL|nr:chemotaxis protein CheW [Alicyclobacillus dauci]WAH36612.1 chemotaxis protein CheW [Alicyclobacillus dauci]